MNSPDAHSLRLENSKFFQRLCAANGTSGADVSSLEATVKMVCSNVAAVTIRVVENFGAYTLHDMTHLWNVVSVMEELIPDDVWETPWQQATDPLGPFQCALCLMAALVHDLGMAPPDGLVAKLNEAENLDEPIPDRADKDFVAYRRHFASCEDDVRAIKALLDKEHPTDADRDEATRRRQMIRTEYLRLTHSDDTIGGSNRIRAWLENWEVPDQYKYRGWPYLDLLVNVATSHAHSGGLQWLESLLGGNVVKQFSSDRVCGLHAAWLLRLGDILDLDASRAPLVLYRSFPPGNRTSEQHWRQHLCISERVINWQVSPATVTFNRGQACRNPEIANGLADYCGWIRDEIENVEHSRDRHDGVLPEQFPLRLPGSAIDENGRPASIRLDADFRVEGGWGSSPIRFELSQQDVVKILMGEELYGEPELCLREVIQNALDATHLRWLRYELRRRMTEKLGEAAYLNYDLPPADSSLNKDDLEIKVSWGVDNLPDDGWKHDGDPQSPDDRHWIQIEDPGTGMTLDVVKKYFTQIGRSYYQSPEYRRDRALFREYGLPASEISQFGIGILSCFMLADMVEVWTCPIPPPPTSQGDCQAYHFRIWGADGLFWHQPTQEKNTPGTRIRMWLKKDRHAACSKARLRRDLFSEHYGEGKKPVLNAEHDSVDPIRAVWSSVPWPRYSVAFLPETQDGEFSTWRLDDSAHFRSLLTPHPKEHRKLYQQINPSRAHDAMGLKWAWWDWEHPETASRVRIALLVSSHVAGSVDNFAALLRLAGDTGEEDSTFLDFLLPFVADTTLPRNGRTQLLVRGMRVPELHDVDTVVGLAAGAGAVVIVDVNGHAAPRLRADRKSLTDRQRDDWRGELDRVLGDWKMLACQHLSRNVDLARTATTTVRLVAPSWYSLADAWTEPGTTVPFRNEDLSLYGGWLNLLNRECERHGTLARDTAMVKARVNSRKRIYARQFNVAFLRLLLSDLTDVSRSEIHVTEKQVKARSIERMLLSNTRGMRIGRAWRRFQDEQSLPELFASRLSTTFPGIAAPVAEGTGRDARLLSPFLLEFQIERPHDTGPSRTVSFASGWYEPPLWLTKLGYDLIAPWTQIPIGQLRSACPVWMTERACRASAILPFQFLSALKWSAFRSVIAKLDQQLQFSKLSDILLMIPDKSLYTLPFKQWKKAQTQDKVVTAYWKLDEDRVLWAEGFHNRQSIAKHGRTLEDLAGIDTD